MTLYVRKPVNLGVQKCLVAAELSGVAVSWVAGRDPVLDRTGVSQLLDGE